MHARKKCIIFTIVVAITTLSDDYSKFVLLESDRYLEFHIQVCMVLVTSYYIIMLFSMDFIIILEYQRLGVTWYTTHHHVSCMWCQPG